jgi:regulator of PEP synthase PpsR (kinase-PPPase family)
MINTYQIYLISDSTGETLDRVFLAIKAQFKNIEYDVKSYFFTRTENQIVKIIEEAKKKKILLFYIQLLTILLLNF